MHSGTHIINSCSKECTNTHTHNSNGMVVNHCVPAFPLKIASFAFPRPKMHEMVLTSLVKSNLLSPLGFSSNTIPSAKGWKCRIIHFCFTNKLSKMSCPYHETFARKVVERTLLFSPKLAEHIISHLIYLSLTSHNDNKEILSSQ